MTDHYMMTVLKMKLLATFANLPESEPSAGEDGSKLVKGYASLIAAVVKDKTVDTIIRDHSRETVFEPNTLPTTNNIKQEWWNCLYPGSSKEGYLARAVYSIGNVITVPPFHKQETLGFLSVRSFNRQTPIENATHNFYTEIAKTNEKLDAKGLLEELVAIFTDDQPLGNNNFENCKLVFVKGIDTLAATRIDIVHAIRVLFYTGFLVFMANPIDFKHYHPLMLITKLFLSQDNFFPTEYMMDEPLSKADQHNFLLLLGQSIYEAIRQPFETEYFILHGPEFFPATNNPTMMPAPPAITFTPAAAPAPPPPPSSSEIEFYYFLWGNHLPGLPGNVDPDAQPLDEQIVKHYKHAVENNFASIPNKSILKILITIICPNDTLDLSKEFFGLSRAAMVALINKHLPAFQEKHDLKSYLEDLERIEPDAD